MPAKQILVIGGGFAGLWSALSAARKLNELALDSSSIKITLINRDPYHTIRVRLYEPDLSSVRLDLTDILATDVELIVGEVTAINTNEQVVVVRRNKGKGNETIFYDRLILAAGSNLYRPTGVSGIENAFSVDTYDDAILLNKHLSDLVNLPRSSARDTVLIVGAGLTGLEVACEMPTRLQAVFKNAEAQTRVILADHSDHIGSNLGNEAAALITTALGQLCIQTRVGVAVKEIDELGAVLESGERIDSKTVIWTAGMRANALTAMLPVGLDKLGRVSVDQYLKVAGLCNVFAAGDVANLLIDGQHSSVMSCQHGRPMGRFAGNNAVADLIEKPMLPLVIPQYVTVLDLGPWGGIYTRGWDRKVVSSGLSAKATKQEINLRRIYPPKGNRELLFAAAAPIIQDIPLY